MPTPSQPDLGGPEWEAAPDRPGLEVRTPSADRTASDNHAAMEARSWRRLAAQARHRLRRPTGPDIAATTLFALAGSMFVAGAVTSGSGDLRNDSTGGLREAILAQASANAALQTSIDHLSAEVATAREKTGGPELDELTAQIDALAPMVGLTEVRGPGITVSLNDARPPSPIPDGMTGDDYIVHQQDVQGVVNALWRGKASGVTVMGQRLVSTSAVRCVGNTVILHGRVYSPPFVIAAVGDVRLLVETLRDDQSVSFFRQWAAEVGMGYTQMTSARIVLPAYTGPITPQSAEPVP